PGTKNPCRRDTNRPTSDERSLSRSKNLTSNCNACQHPCAEFARNPSLTSGRGATRSVFRLKCGPFPSWPAPIGSGNSCSSTSCGGWSSESIGKRYGVTKNRVRQVLILWKRRAILLGFIQYIPPSDPLVAHAGCGLRAL